MAEKEMKKEQKKRKQPEKKSTAELDICQKAPEWAEHERLSDEDEPCDDFRKGSE